MDSARPGSTQLLDDAFRGSASHCVGSIYLSGGGNMLEDWRKDLKSGLRILAKSPGFTAVAVAALGVGSGASTAIFANIDAVCLHPLPVAEPSQLVEVFTRDTRTVQAASNFILTGSSIPNFQDYRDQNSVCSGMAAATFP